MRVTPLVAAILVAALCTLPPSVGGEFTSPELYGRVVIGRFSPGAGMSKVVFDHWLHRAHFTCRVCHVDIGFAMEGGATGLRAADNAKGYFCGACHNGKLLTYAGPVFKSCSTTPTAEEEKHCRRCHSLGSSARRRHDFATFAAGMPMASLGNRIDWEKAEEAGLITPKDFVQGISVRKGAMPARDDMSLESRGTWMGDIRFSHRKHSRWNGCELCHPDIFLGVKKGASSYTMMEIYGGSYCGVCHLKVAFPLQDCSRCHVKPVR
jgi:c(7)-type cytochrome triheme protein